MDLREMLDAVIASDADHATRLAKSAAIVCEALRREGLEATVVGGAAIEFHAPDAYSTTDLDLVVSGRFGVDWTAAQTRTFQALGFSRDARHWVRDDLYVEIPGRTMTDPVVVMRMDPFPLRVVAKEVVLADRIVGFKYWGVTDYGIQAIAMLDAFGTELDEQALRHHLKREQAEDAYERLRRLSESDEPADTERVAKELEALHGRGGTNER
jgi:hypothetical protein